MKWQTINAITILIALISDALIKLIDTINAQP